MQAYERVKKLAIVRDIARALFVSQNERRRIFASTCYIFPQTRLLVRPGPAYAGLGQRVKGEGTPYFFLPAAAKLFRRYSNCLFLLNLLLLSQTSW